MAAHRFVLRGAVARRASRRLAVPTVLAVLLAGCVTITEAGDDTDMDAEAPAPTSPSEPHADADDAVVSSETLFPEDAEAFSAEELELMSMDMSADPEVQALAAVSWAAEATVRDIEDAPADLPGAMVLSVESDEIVWADDVRWNLGARELIEPPDAGAVLRLLADDIWQVSTREQLLVAVALEPNPDDAYDGFAEFLARPDGQVLPARSGVVEARRVLADRLRETGDQAREHRDSRRAALLELLEDASAQIDAINTGEEDAPVPGLLGEVVGSAAASDSP